VKLYVDSVDPAEISSCVAASGTTGVATRASLLGEAAGRTGKAPEDVLRAICAVANGPVIVEVAAGADDREAMLREARAFAGVGAGVVALLPATDAGLEVVRACAAEKIRTAIGGFRSPEHALAAVRAGASLLSAPVGLPGSGASDLIRKLVALLRTYGEAAEVVAGEIRMPTHVIDAALAGAHAAAVPAAVLRELPAESVRGAEAGRR